MKQRVQAGVVAVFYGVLFFAAHLTCAALPFDGDPAWRTITANLFAAVIGLLVAAALGEHPFRARHAVRARPLLFSALFGGGFAGVMLLLMTYIPLPPDWLERYTAHSGTPSERTAIGWVSALIVAPIAEEILFRGLLYPSLTRALHAIPAAVLVSAYFGAIHGTLLWEIYTFLLSLFAIWVMQRVGSLWAAILFHGAFNLCGQLPGLFPDGLPWLDWLYLGVCSVAFLVSGVLLMRRKRS